VHEGLAVLVGELARRLRLLAGAEDAAEDLGGRRREVREVEADVQQRVAAPGVDLADVDPRRGGAGRERAQQEESGLRLLEGDGVPEDTVAVAVDQPAACQQPLRGEALERGDVSLNDGLPDHLVRRALAGRASRRGAAPRQQRRRAQGKRGDSSWLLVQAQRGVRDDRRLGDH